MNIESPPQLQTPELRYPGLLVLGCALGLSTSVAPIYLGPFSIFLLPISEEFGWTRGDMSAVFATTALGIAVASPMIGSWVNRVGARRVLMIGIVSFAISIAGISRLSGSLPLYFALSAVVGVTGAATNTFVYVSILPQWFTARLGMMLGIAMTGIGIGQTAMPILSQFLISELGWRNAYLGLASLPVLIALPCVVFLLRERDSSAEGDADATPSGASDARDFLRSGAFWMLGASFLVIAVAAGGLALHTFPILIDRGFTEMEAASLAAAGGVSVFVGRLGAGVLLDYLGARVVGAVVFLAAAVGPLLLASFGPPALLYVVPVFMGFALGAEGDLMPYAIRKRFGLQNYSVIYGWLFGLFNGGVLIGPLLLGFYYDATGSYDGMLLMIGVAVGLLYPAFWQAVGAGNDSTRTEMNDPWSKGLSH